MIDLVAEQVWLAPGATDMRKSIDALAVMAQHVIGQDPLGPHVFVWAAAGAGTASRSCIGIGTGSGCSTSAWSPGRSCGLAAIRGLDASPGGNSAGYWRACMSSSDRRIWHCDNPDAVASNEEGNRCLELHALVPEG